MTVTVETWLLDLRPSEAQLNEYRPLLTVQEQSRFEQIRYPRDKSAFASRRVQRRLLLASLLGAAPEELVFDHNAFGKPTLRQAGDLQFNCSSSGDVGLCIVSRGVDLGCDIERRDPLKASKAITERFFAPAERVALANLPANQWLEGFFNVWTGKEAFLKCLGCGLSGELDALTVSLAPSSPAAILSQDGFVAAAFRPLPDYQVAVVARSAERLRIEPACWWGESRGTAPQRLASAGR